MAQQKTADVIIIGGGLAGLSAGIYLGRALRDTLIIDEGKSMARWEPAVQNYLGFPEGVSGEDLVTRGREHAKHYGARLIHDRVEHASRTNNGFSLQGQSRSYSCSKLLLATGIFHVPPDLPGVKPCLGHSMFFCKDCDGFRVQGKAVAIYGWRNEAVEYALGMLPYTSCVAVVTDGRKPVWDEQHARWLSEYELPVYLSPIHDVKREGSQLQALHFDDGTEVEAYALFTTRGDVYFNHLAKELGATLDDSGEILVDADMLTSVPGLYAAGCVTPANCQMIIAAGQGATAAQSINRALFEQSLASHRLRRFRKHQVKTKRTRPLVRRHTATPVRSR